MKTIYRFAAALFLLLSCLAYGLDKTNTGFVYPTGNSNFDSAGGTWLGRDAAHEDASEYPHYFGGFYHTGVDMMTYSTDHQTYAISDGIVIGVHDDKSSWGITDGKANSAVFILHYTDQGDAFTCLYGHIQRQVSKGDFVSAGSPLGRTGDYVGGIHLHIGCFWGVDIPPTDRASHRGWGRMGNEWWDKDDSCTHRSPDTDCFVDPIELMRSHRPGTLFPKGDQNLFSVGPYLFRNSDYCPNADQWYRVVDSSRDDYWITADVSRDTACEGVTDVTEQMLLSGQENDGVVKTEQVVSKWERARSAVASWLSQVVSGIKSALSWALPADAAEPSVQKILTVNRSGKVYSIAGTNKEILVLTDGPGMKGDKAIDPYSGYQSDPSGTLETGLSPSSGKKLPDIGISGEWFERSSGRKHDDVDWGSTLCPTVYVRSKGDGDAPKDVKLSYFLSKGYNVDRSPRHFGYEMIAKRDMRTGRSKNVSHCVGFNDGDYPAYPGRYNFTAVANSDHAFAESKMTNNKSTAYSFVIKENAHLIAQFHFLNGVVPGQSVSVAVTISNTGTPFGQDFVYTQYRIQGPEYGENPVIIGIDQTRRDHLRTGDIANEQFSFMAPMAPGDYIVIAEVDYTGIVNQSDRSGSVFLFAFTIPESDASGDLEE